METTPRLTAPRATHCRRLVARAGLLCSALLLFAIAWFLPVHKYGKTLPETLPGGEALLVALSSDWDPGNLARCYAAALSVASALSNLLVVILAFAWRRRSERLIRVVGWACIISLGLNAQWFLSDARSELRMGYYLWWLSVGVLGFACLLPAQKCEPAGHDPARELSHP